MACFMAWLSEPLGALLRISGMDDSDYYSPSAFVKRCALTCLVLQVACSNAPVGPSTPPGLLLTNKQLTVLCSHKTAQCLQFTLIVTYK